MFWALHRSFQDGRCATGKPDVLTLFVMFWALHRSFQDGRCATGKPDVLTLFVSGADPELVVEVQRGTL